MERLRRLFSKTNSYQKFSDQSSITSFRDLNMSGDTPKKPGGVLERFITWKGDLAENLERRRHLHSNQVHFTHRSNNTSEDALVIEKRPPTPPETRQRHASGDENSISERSSSFSQTISTLGKKNSNESSTSMPSSASSFDLFNSENSEQAKEMIKTSLRQEIKRLRTRAISESGSDEAQTPKAEQRPISPSTTATVPKFESHQRKPTMLLAGPHFRSHTIQSEKDFKRDTIYPVSIFVGILSIVLLIWKPISPLISGYILGFLSAGAIAYVIIRMYLNAKTETIIEHEWMNFPELELVMRRQDKQINSTICCEIVFGRYDPDHDADFVRYPVVIRLENQQLTMYLPNKTKSEEKKEKEIVFVGFREYSIKKTKLILVPEGTLQRKKYWLNEYPIVLQNIEILNKQINNKSVYEKSKFDTEEFFNNSQTILSLFFETCPDKEDWFHRLSRAIRKYPEGITPSIPLVHSHSDTQISSKTIEHRVHTKSMEPVSSNSPDDRTSMLNRSENDLDSLSDTSQTPIGAQDTNEKESDATNRSNTMKKKVLKQAENLERLLSSPDCLDEAAITLNFLTRRLFCDVFDEPLFKDILKENIEMKLKEIAVSILDDLRVEKIDMGNTFPVILKVESMQWNAKGIWLNLYLFYRGSFKITIKTRIVLQRLLNYNPTTEHTMHYQPQTDQIIHKDDVQDEQRQKFASKDIELPENLAARRIGTLLTKVAANRHFQRFAALKPVAGVIEKLSNAEIGANIELTNISGMMTINIPPPPSDRVWVGFAEMPDLNLIVTPVFGESQYSYALIHELLEARIRDEIKRLLVLPAMDDQLLPFLRDWVLHAMGPTNE